MKKSTRSTLQAVLVFSTVVASACGAPEPAGTSADGHIRAFAGATIVDGTGGPVIADGVLLVGEDGRIAAVGAASGLAVPEGAERIDLSGRS